MSDIFQRDVVDLRDVTDRVEALRGERDAFSLSCAACGGAEQPAAPIGETDAADCGDCDGDGVVSDTAASRHAWRTENPDDAAELTLLESVLEDLAGYGGDHQWEGTWYPGSLIDDAYFETYAQELAEDIGAIPDDAKWPATCIDWEQAARELQQDYSSIDIDGHGSWWYR